MCLLFHVIELFFCWVRPNRHAACSFRCFKVQISPILMSDAQEEKKLSVFKGSSPEPCNSRTISRVWICDRLSLKICNSYKSTDFIQLPVLWYLKSKSSCRPRKWRTMMCSLSMRISLPLFTESGSTPFNWRRRQRRTQRPMNKFYKTGSIRSVICRYLLALCSVWPMTVLCHPCRKTALITV